MRLVFKGIILKPHSGDRLIAYGESHRDCGAAMLHHNQKN
jgi:hypothetical protein